MYIGFELHRVSWERRAVEWWSGVDEMEVERRRQGHREEEKSLLWRAWAV